MSASQVTAASPDGWRDFPVPAPFDFYGTLAPVRRSGLNPSVRLAHGHLWRATRTPAGPATEHLTLGRGQVHAEAWGPGASWLLRHAPDLCGVADDPSAFTPRDELLASLATRWAGLRLTRTAAVLEALVATVAEQKVPGLEAWRAHAALVRSLGEPAPGPAPLTVPPAPEVLAETPYFVYHRFGIERRRAETIRYAAAHAGRLEEIPGLDPEAGTRRLQSLPGVGPWSAAEVMLVACGHADAVSVGDYHLPHVVARAYLGQRHGTDELMLRLLEPYRGQRARVIRYLEAAGIGPPRRGPRMPARRVLDYNEFGRPAPGPRPRRIQ